MSAIPPVAAPVPPPPAPAKERLQLTTLLGMMFNPASILQRQLRESPPLPALLLSGTAFALFFLQSGLDQVRVGKGTLGGALGLMVLGAVYGSVGVALVAALNWVLSRHLGADKPLKWALRAYALAYAPALVYSVLGLLASLLLGWRTAVAFGVTGVLWAMGPMMAVNDQLTGHRRSTSVILTAVGGCLILLGWAVLGTK